MVRLFIGVLMVLFAGVQTAAAQQKEMVMVPINVLLEGEIIAAHTTPTQSPMFPRTAVVLRHDELGIVHCHILVSMETTGYERDVACAAFK